MLQTDNPTPKRPRGSKDWPDLTVHKRRVSNLEPLSYKRVIMTRCSVPSIFVVLDQTSSSSGNACSPTAQMDPHPTWDRTSRMLDSLADTARPHRAGACCRALASVPSACTAASAVACRCRSPAASPGGIASGARIAQLRSFAPLIAGRSCRGRDRVGDEGGSRTPALYSRSQSRMQSSIGTGKRGRGSLPS